MIMTYVCVIRTTKKTPDGGTIFGITKLAKFNSEYPIEIGSILHLTKLQTGDVATSVRVDEVEHVFFPDRPFACGLVILGVSTNSPSIVYTEENDGSPMAVEVPSLYSCWEIQACKTDKDTDFLTVLEKELPPSKTPEEMDKEFREGIKKIEEEWKTHAELYKNLTLFKKKDDKESTEETE